MTPQEHRDTAEKLLSRADVISSDLAALVAKGTSQHADVNIILNTVGCLALRAQAHATLAGVPFIRARDRMDDDE